MAKLDLHSTPAAQIIWAGSHGVMVMTLTQEQLSKLKLLREELFASKEDERDAAIHFLCGLGMAEVTGGIPRITTQGLHELERYGSASPHRTN